MNVKAKQIKYNISRMSPPELSSVIHTEDSGTRKIELHLFNQNTPIDISGSSATARFVSENRELVNDNVACNVTDDNVVLIPLDVLSDRTGQMYIEVKIVSGDKVLTLPYPLTVYVRGTILEMAHILPESGGTIPELLERVEEELARVQDMGDGKTPGEVGAGVNVSSASVNQNGTITFTLSDGSTVTATGESVIGPQGQAGTDGISPTATVTQTATGATITITDANGTTTANVSNGTDGNDYILTNQDKSDIANIVLGLLPTTQGVQYGNQSN